MTYFAPLALAAAMLAGTVQSSEWYDKATKATIDANKRLDAAMKSAIGDWKRLDATKGTIKTRADLLALIGKMKGLVRTLDGRISAAEKRHIQSKRYLRNSLFADEIKSGDDLHKTMTNRFAQMNTRVADARKIVKALSGEIAKTDRPTLRRPEES